jgi:hypothetical protein
MPSPTYKVRNGKLLRIFLEKEDVLSWIRRYTPSPLLVDADIKSPNRES